MPNSRNSRLSSPERTLLRNCKLPRKYSERQRTREKRERAREREREHLTNPGRLKDKTKPTCPPNYGTTHSQFFHLRIYASRLGTENQLSEKKVRFGDGGKVCRDGELTSKSNRDINFLQNLSSGPPPANHNILSWEKHRHRERGSANGTQSNLLCFLTRAVSIC